MDDKILRFAQNDRESRLEDREVLGIPVHVMLSERSESKHLLRRAWWMDGQDSSLSLRMTGKGAQRIWDAETVRRCHAERTQ